MTGYIRSDSGFQSPRTQFSQNVSYHWSRIFMDNCSDFLRSFGNNKIRKIYKVAFHVDKFAGQILK